MEARIATGNRKEETMRSLRGDERSRRYFEKPDREGRSGEVQVLHQLQSGFGNVENQGSEEGSRGCIRGKMRGDKLQEANAEKHNIDRL